MKQRPRVKYGEQLQLYTVGFWKKIEAFSPIKIEANASNVVLPFSLE